MTKMENILFDLLYDTMVRVHALEALNIQEDDLEKYTEQCRSSRAAIDEQIRQKVREADGGDILNTILKSGLK